MTTLYDIQKMKEILVKLNYSESLMEEYYYILDLARKAKELALQNFEPHAIPCGFGSWCKDQWNDFMVSCEKGRAWLDESYCQLVHNQDRLEQILAQKKAQEYYFSHAVYNEYEMEEVAKAIREKDLALGQELRTFLYEHSRHLAVGGAAIASTVISANMTNPMGICAALLVFGPQCYEIMDYVQKNGRHIWNQYEALLSSRGRLTRMDRENREASYARCIVEGISPTVHFAPEKDTPWYNGYYSIDANHQRIEFQFGISKPF